LIMAGISKGETGSEVKLSSAILFYSGQQGENYATVHPVTAGDGGRKKASRPVIGAGRPVDREALLRTLGALAANTAPAADFLPVTVLGISSSALTWWCAPAKRRVFFECKELGGKRTAVVHHPGLVFQAAASGFRVFAIEGKDRPTADTGLFEPPYFNTWDLGKICIGTARVPKRINVAAIAGWEEGFFNSAFTHPNHGSKRVEYEDGFYAFWRDMLEGKFSKAYPLKVLVPMKKTVRDLVTGKIERGVA
jgi:PRTRC genetic system protein B